MPEPFSAYLASLRASLTRGDATEHTHRPALKALVEALQPGLTVTNEPKQIQCGAPDLLVSKGLTPLGSCGPSTRRSSGADPHPQPTASALP